MENKMKANNTLHLAFKAIGLAMGVATMILNALGVATASTQITLLAIGLFALAMSTFHKE
jgi:hypothetical protein